MSDHDSQVYSRLYHRLMNEYPSIWNRDETLALFVRMLVIADKFWPERPPLARRNAKGLRALLTAGLVRLHDDGFTYSVRGLDAERSRRSNAARTAARIKHAMRDAVPSKDETSKEKKDAAHLGQHDNCLVCEPLRRPQIIEGGKGA